MVMVSSAERDLALAKLIQRMRLARYVFLSLGVVFLAWEVITGAVSSFNSVLEVVVVSIMGPSMAWLFSSWGEGVVREARQRYQELVALNQVTQQVLEHRTQLSGELKETRAHLKMLLGVNQVMHQGLPPGEAADRVLDVVLEAMGVEAGEVWLLAPLEKELWPYRQRGFTPAAFREKMSFSLGEGFPGIAAQTGKPVFTCDLAHDTRFIRRGVVEAGFTCFGAIPLLRGEEVIGAMTVGSRHMQAISDVEVEFLVSLGRNLTLLLQPLIGGEQR